MVLSWFMALTCVQQLLTCLLVNTMFVHGGTTPAHMLAVCTCDLEYLHRVDTVEPAAHMQTDGCNMPAASTTTAWLRFQRCGVSDAVWTG